MTDDQLNNQLKQAQAKHLQAIERWAMQQPRVAGVPILQALTYDLIQVTNQAYLRRILANQQPGPAERPQPAQEQPVNA